MTALRSLRDLVKTLRAPQPEPPPATLDPESVPPGHIRFDTGLFRLPHSGPDAESKAAELQHLAEVVGSVEDMRRVGVDPARIRLHIPKTAPVAASPKSKESNPVGITTATYSRLQDHDAVPQPKPAEAPKPAVEPSTPTLPPDVSLGDVVHMVRPGTDICVAALVMTVHGVPVRPGADRERQKLHRNVSLIDFQSPLTSRTRLAEWSDSTDPAPATDRGGYPTTSLRWHLKGAGCQFNR